MLLRASIITQFNTLSIPLARVAICLSHFIHCAQGAIALFLFNFVPFYPQRISISPGDRGGRTPDSKKMKKEDSDGERSDQVRKQSDETPMI
jgi:hypothetical protein